MKKSIRRRSAIDGTTATWTGLCYGSTTANVGRKRATSLLRGHGVKVTMDIDCSPEEARRLMGLPDLSSVHEVYLGKMRRTIDEGVTPDMVEALLRNWAPMGEASMSMWRQLFEQMSGTSTKK